MDSFVQWSYHPATKRLKAQWINSDGSTPKTIYAYYQQGIFFLYLSVASSVIEYFLHKALFLTGDFAKLRDFLGGEEYVWHVVSTTLASHLEVYLNISDRH